MPTSQIIANVSQLRRDETVFTLARIAADLANSAGGVLGKEARAWTHDLLAQRQHSKNPLEAAIAKAVASLPPGRAIAHAQSLFSLQLLAIVRGAPSGVIPHDGYLAFMLAALNDHLPEWPSDPDPPLTSGELALVTMFLSSVFNRHDDGVRFLVRTLSIFGTRTEHDPIAADDWKRIEDEAFGTSFAHYAESFLAPFFLISTRWSHRAAPVLWREHWAVHNRALVDRWLSEASISIEDATATMGSRPLPSGLFGLPGAFFRTPLVRFEEKYVGLSPWHVRDHVGFGTWGKLNAASKRVLGTESNQRFSSTFGYRFEGWCRTVASEAAASDGFEDRIVLPTHSGSDDEIEDVVFVRGDLVALLSAKASMVPEAKLKSAKSEADVLDWLKRFFFEERGEAKSKGYRGGAIHQLDRNIDRLRAGAFVNRGLKPDATVLPAIICFDNVGESGLLYKWLEEECRRRNLLCARPNVRPLTIIEAKNYDALLALAAKRRSLCNLLDEKSGPHLKWAHLDRFMHERSQGLNLRLPSIDAGFARIVDNVLDRLRDGKA